MLDPRSKLWTETLAPIGDGLPAATLLARKFSTVLLSRVHRRLEEAPKDELSPVALQVRGSLQRAVGAFEAYLRSIPPVLGGLLLAPSVNGAKRLLL